MWGGWSLEDGEITWIKETQWWINKALVGKGKPVNDTWHTVETEIQILSFLTSATDQSECSASSSARFTPTEITKQPTVEWEFNCGLFGPHSQSGHFVEEKSLFPTRKWAMVHPACSITFYLYMQYVTSTRDTITYLKKQMHTRLW
jgi:hypothetical protein